MRQNGGKKYFFNREIVENSSGWFFNMSYLHRDVISRKVNNSHYVILKLWKDEAHTQPLTFDYFKNNLWIGGFSDNPNDMVKDRNDIAYPHQGYNDWSLFVQWATINYWWKDGIKPTAENHTCIGYYTLTLSNDGKTSVTGNKYDACGWLSINLDYREAPQNVYVDLGTEDFSDDDESNTISSLLEEARKLQYDRVGKKRDYSKALDLLDEAVKEDKDGASDAVWELGLMHLRKQGFVEWGNIEGMAYDLFKKSANGGNPIGFYWLAYCLEHGYGDEGKNVQKAEELYKTAYIKLKQERNINDPYACQYLGFMEYYGKHTDETPQWEKARPWLEEAAKAGLTESQLLLGSAYDRQIGETIQGLQEDPVKAEEWYTKAAAKGNDEAQLRLGELNERLSGNSNATEFSKNIRKRDAFKWYQESARQDNPSALLRLGFCYEKGFGTDKNRKEAIDCFKKAAQLGNSVAKQKLIDMGEEM